MGLKNWPPAPRTCCWSWGGGRWGSSGSPAHPRSRARSRRSKQYIFFTFIYIFILKIESSISEVFWICDLIRTRPSKKAGLQEIKKSNCLEIFNAYGKPQKSSSLPTLELSGHIFLSDFFQASKKVLFFLAAPLLLVVRQLKKSPFCGIPTPIYRFLCVSGQYRQNNLAKVINNLIKRWRHNFHKAKLLNELSFTHSLSNSLT